MGDADQPEIRISDADRDAVVTRLSDALTEGRIDVSEFETRSRQAYAATVPSDLAPLLADLPSDTLPVVQPNTSAAGAGSPSSVPTAGTRRLFSIFGDIRRSGQWEPGERTRCFALFGDTELDVSSVEAHDLDIVVWSVFGDLRVTVAPGARIDANSIALFGDFVDADVPTAPLRGTVRVRSYALFGDLKLFRA